MEDETEAITEQSPAASRQERTAEEERAELRRRLEQKNKERGIKPIPYDEYIALKKKKAKSKIIRLPKPVRFFLSTPFIIIFCFGLLFIPFMFYLIVVNSFGK